VGLEAAAAAAGAGRGAGPARAAALARLGAVEGLVRELEAGISAAAAADPAKVAALAEAGAQATAAANRWLDNVYALKAWCAARFGEGRGAELDGFFEEQGLTAKVDYI
jgi:hypothetical protein